MTMNDGIIVIAIVALGSDFVAVVVPGAVVFQDIGSITLFVRGERNNVLGREQ